MASTAKRVMKNSFWLYGKMFFSIIASLLSTRIILNGLGVADFGIYNIVGGTIAMLGFLNAAMASATQRFMSYAEGEGQIVKKIKIFNVSLVLHYVLSILICIILVIVGFLFFNIIFNIPENRIFASKIVYGCFILSTMMTIISVPYDAVINSHENMRYYAIIGSLESFLRLCAAYLCITFHDKLVAYGILMAIVPFSTLILMRIYCYKKYDECKISIFNYWDKHVFKELSQFAGWNFIGTSSSLIGNYGMRIVMNHFYGVLLNAAQGITAQVSALVMTFSSNMIKSLNPVISKAEGAGNRDKVIEMTLTGNKFSFFMLAFLGIPLSLESEYILSLWLQNVPKWTAVFVKLQIVRLLIEQLTIVSETTINAQGNISRYNIVMFFINILPIILTFFIFKMGASPYMMYFITITIFGIMVCIVRVFFMKKNCNIPYLLFVYKCFVPAIVSFFIVICLSIIPLFIMDDGMIRLFLVLLLSTLIGCLSYYYIGLDLNEKILVKTLINPMLSKIKIYKWKNE